MMRRVRWLTRVVLWFKRVLWLRRVRWLRRVPPLQRARRLKIAQGFVLTRMQIRKQQCVTRARMRM